ncbi:MAG: hypothetical protein QOG59_1150, partial [Solirubrobacteraceae bacterium]|nr:hypothetical protein [Solirubrobacteraceae bacterium]
PQDLEQTEAPRGSIDDRVAGPVRRAEEVHRLAGIVFDLLLALG